LHQAQRGSRIGVDEAVFAHAVIRVISARKATATERKHYQDPTP
jgi:uncharacterized DUF497 family protein